MDLKTEIIKIIKDNSYKVEYKHTNGYELAEIELSDVADEIVKLIIPIVSQQRELLIAFMKWQQNQWLSVNAENVDNTVDTYLSNL